MIIEKIPNKIKFIIPFDKANSYTEQNLYSIKYLLITSWKEYKISLRNLSESYKKWLDTSFWIFPETRSIINPINNIKITLK